MKARARGQGGEGRHARGRRDAGAATTPPWLPFCAAAAALVLTVFAYRPGMSAGFYFDDLPNIVEAPALHWSHWSFPNLLRVLHEGPLVRRPVANLSFALNSLFSGLRPAAYHWTNLAIHLLVGIVLAWVITLLADERCRTQGDRVWVRLSAWVASALFLLHPLNVQAVTYVVQRMTLLATLFCLLAFALYLVARTRLRQGSAWRRPAAGCFLAWLLALGSKEIAAALPAVVMAHAATSPGGWKQVAAWARRYRRGLLPAALAAVCLLAVLLYRLNPWLAVWRWNLPLPLRDFTMWQRLLSESRVQWFYLGLLAWPAPSRLNLDHQFIVSRSLLDPPATGIAVLAWVGVAVAAILLVRCRSPFAFPLIAYLLLHLIESGPLNLELLFEHRMYLPMTMVAIGLGLALTAVRRRRLVVVAACCLACACLAAGTRARNRTWADPLRFARDCAAKSPEKFRPQYNLGTELAVRGHYPQAESAFRRALALRPDDSMTHNQLGNIEQIGGREETALAEYRAAVAANPRNAEALYNLAGLYDRRGNRQEALRTYRRFLAVSSGRLAEQRKEIRARVAVLAGEAERLNELPGHVP